MYGLEDYTRIKHVMHNIGGVRRSDAPRRRSLHKRRGGARWPAGVSSVLIVLCGPAPAAAR